MAGMTYKQRECRRSAQAVASRFPFLATTERQVEKPIYFQKLTEQANYWLTSSQDLSRGPLTILVNLLRSPEEFPS
jgi:hypothetical protein